MSEATEPDANTALDHPTGQVGPGADNTDSPGSGPMNTVTPNPPAKNSTARLAWLHKELGRQMGVYRRRRKRDKRKAFALQMATVTLSAAITVLLGLRVAEPAQERLANVALTLGAIITVLAAAEAFFAHRGLWILRTETVRDLENLVRSLDYYKAGLDQQPPNPAAVERYRTELDRILAADLSAWHQLRAATPSGEPRIRPNEMETADNSSPAAAPTGTGL